MFEVSSFLLQLLHLGSKLLKFLLQSTRNNEVKNLVGCDTVSVGKLLLMFSWTTIQEDYSVLKMKAIRLSGMSGTPCPTTQYHIIGD